MTEGYAESHHGQILYAINKEGVETRHYDDIGMCVEGFLWISRPIEIYIYIYMFSRNATGIFYFVLLRMQSGGLFTS